MVDRRLSPLVARTRAPRLVDHPRGLPQVYRGGTRKQTSDVYDADQGGRRGHSFRWLLSTCIAAAVGAVAIGVVLLGSLEPGAERDQGLDIVRRLQEASRAQPSDPGGAPKDGLRWASPKGDRLQAAGQTQQSARHIIHDQIQVKRDNRPFIQIRPYMKIVARLAAVPPTHADVIPPFNPFRLYAASSSTTNEPESSPSEGRTDVAIRVLELLGGILPGEDGQELDTQEVAEIVARSQESERDVAADIAAGRAGVDDALQRVAVVPPNTSVITKSGLEPELVADDLEPKEVRVVRVGRGDTMQKILLKLGTEAWQARAMVEAARTIFPETAVQPGQEVHVTMVASLTKPDRMEPARFSIYGDGHDHKVSVNRNAAGEFVPSTTPFDSSIARVSLSDSEAPQSSSLYAGLYNAALTHGLSPDTILQILRIHAYETDFRRRVGNSDAIEFFFDVKDEAGSEPAPGELLATAIIAGGEAQRFWRYRTSDGIVDYYDENGHNSRKFLMRRPARGEAVQLTSGFGMRRHPALGFMRMHSGVDWSGPIGTPIMAAGNGTIEEAKFKGEYGNYIRIRHANGYSTTYGHMNRFAPGIGDGSKVRQGQVIGFIGTTGMSTGPHLHFEVLVNDRFVDPMSIQVPRERKLGGKMLAEFQKERQRIDELMRRAPVQTITR